jgi:hypothetical protein
MRTASPLTLAWKLTAIVLAGCAGYEAAIALGWISIGAVSGEGAPGDTFVVLLAAFAIVAAAVLIAFGAPRTLVVIGAAVVVARFLTYDPYYAPSLRRMSDGGLFSPWWIGLLALAAVVAAAVRVRSPAVAVAVVVLGTLLLEGAGH